VKQLVGTGYNDGLAPVAGGAMLTVARLPKADVKRRP
jgi:hypothetical protein